MEKLSASTYLTREERKMLMQKNDLQAAIEVIVNWLWIVAAFALVYFFPNILTILIALFILGGKQLACAILMHDASHHAVFTHPKVNDFVGKWFGAYPVFQDMLKYRPYHYRHHVTTGTDDDPDLLLTRGYPTSRASMFRKFTRDLTGITGIKTHIGLLMLHLEYLQYGKDGKLEKVSQKNRTWGAFFRTLLQNLGGAIFTNALIWGICWLIGAPYLYLLWIGAMLTTFQFSLRVRSMAEHSMVEDSEDPIRNTRTTYANWLERMLFAPYHVNFHLEHHMLMAVPPYNLPKMHELLKERGFYEKGLLEKGYWRILRMAVKEG
ncbi:MAG: fatty acid desaturase family protein [Chitinophagales bacterium]